MDEPTLTDYILHYLSRLTAENQKTILARLIIAVEAQNADEEI